VERFDKAKERFEEVTAQASGTKARGEKLDLIIADLKRQDGLVRQLAGKILQRALETEMDLHLGYEQHDPAGDNSGDGWNGHTFKTIPAENQGEVRAPKHSLSAASETMPGP
jgi:transposase-like protein